MSSSNEKLEKIKEILLKHKGKANAIKSKEIAKMLRTTEDDTHGGTRGLITQVMRDGFPVGSCNKGYFMLETQAEVDAYRRMLNGRINEIVDRIGWLQRNFDTYGKI